MTAANIATAMMNMNPVLKAVLSFIAFISLYLGSMAILSAMMIIPFELALEPIRVLTAVFACCYGACRITSAATASGSCV